MVSGETVALGVGALAVAEATGTTDFISSGSTDGQRDGQTPARLAALRARVAALGTLAGNGGGPGGSSTTIDLAGLGERAGQVPAGVFNSLANYTAQARDATNDARAAAEAATTAGQVASSTYAGLTQGGIPGVSGSARSSRSTTLPFDPGRSDRVDLQDYAGTGGLSGILALGGEAGTAIGSGANAAGGFVRENPFATGGAAVGLLAAPFTGGASIPAGAVAAGGVAEVGADLVTGQYGDTPDEAIRGFQSSTTGQALQLATTPPKLLGSVAGSSYDAVAGAADAAAGGTDEYVGGVVSRILGGASGGGRGSSSADSMVAEGDPTGSPPSSDATTESDAGVETQRKADEVRKRVVAAGGSGGRVVR